VDDVESEREREGGKNCTASDALDEAKQAQNCRNQKTSQKGLATSNLLSNEALSLSQMIKPFAKGENPLREARQDGL
jgi:hypothetical protein